MKGVVYKSTGNWCYVHTNANVIYRCNIKGKFRNLNIKSTNPVAVGDHVIFDITNQDKKEGVINKIEYRKNYIIRKSVNLSKQTQIIASNIDCCFLFVTPSNPSTSTLFIDRVLVTTEAFGIETIMLFNKIDIYNEKDLNYVDELRKIYSKIGYKCLKISVKNELNIEKVEAQIINKVSVFTGHSGVGKTSLMNILNPELNLRTSETTKQHEQGKHTTTFAEMFDFQNGAKIIDSPGLKGFGLTEIEKNEIGLYFREIEKLRHKCKFNNCIHLNEPDCAIKSAIENDEISESRYKNYLNLLEDDNNNFRI